MPPRTAGHVIATVGTLRRLVTVDRLDSMFVRTFLTRRWLLFAAVVAVMAWGAVRLGEWQFDRQHEREQRNAWIEANLAAAPAPVADVLGTEPLPESQEWRRVQARGVYDESGTLVWRYQTRDGDSGVDVVTPLVLPDGRAVLVDRGWLPTDDPGFSPDDAPAPPSGTVTVVGWARADSTGRHTEVSDGSTRELSSREVQELVDHELLEGFVDAETETPAATTELQTTELPDLGEGPHFFYGLQWWFFGALAVFGFGYLMWDERRGRRRTSAVTATAADPRRPGAPHR
jgi:cytochrome oxidase assembly protein ShyY1